MKPLLIAHRGNTVGFPENTMEAFASAFQKGADGIELDIHFYNGHLIVVHNYLFDRAASYPTLDAVLERFASLGRLEIEVKTFDSGYLPTLSALLLHYKDADLEVTTSVIPLVSYMVNELPVVKRGIIFQEREFEEWMPPHFIRDKIIGYMKLLRGNVAHLPSHILTDELVDALHTHGYKVHSHIPGYGAELAARQYKKLLKLGVDQLTFDEIGLLELIRPAA